jgi:hypothetical protein
MICGQGRNTSAVANFPTGAQYLRIHDNGRTTWRQIHTAKGSFNWAGLDAQLASAQGLPSIFTISSTPAWTAIPVSGAPAGIQGTLSNCPFHQEDFADFVDALLNHVRLTNGSLGIRAFELRNETNSSVWWCGADSDLLQAAQTLYTKVKAIDHTALVTTPTPCWAATDVVTALDRYFSLGFQQYADVMAFHGYLPTGSVALAIVPTLIRLRGLLTKYNLSMPIWDTESGFKTNINYMPGWVRDWFTARVPYIDAAFWYQYDNQTNGTCWNPTTKALTPAGLEWVSAINTLNAPLPAVNNIIQHP